MRAGTYDVYGVEPDNPRNASEAVDAPSSIDGEAISVSGVQAGGALSFAKLVSAMAGDS